MKIFIMLSIILAIGVFAGGCEDSSETADSGGAAASPAATTSAGPLYAAGDIVRSASGSDSPAWLVLDYDAAADSYTRALIYKNTDGSYGYRTGPATETSKRAIMERVYTVKITHIDAGSVPSEAPTTATTVETTTVARTTTTSAAAATTTLSTARPSIKEMDPDEGEAGTTVVTEITGSDFLKNLTAKLRHSGEDSLTATTVSWYSSSSVTCTFELPNTTKVGTWDIVITNPNGLSGEIANYFIVHGNETVT